MSSQTGIRREEAKSFRAGPPGPAAGSGLVAAHVMRNGEVDLSRPRGITQENVVKVDIHDPRGVLTFYCFTGLSPDFIGGQVTVDAVGHEVPSSASLDLDVGDPGCQYAVLLDNSGRRPQVSGAFYVSFSTRTTSNRASVGEDRKLRALAAVGTYCTAPLPNGL